MDAQQIVARWNAEERSARLSEPGAARREQASAGMEMFDAIFAGELPPAPIGDTLDFLAIHIEPRTAVFQGRPRPIGPMRR